jgi:hypothetical protein
MKHSGADVSRVNYKFPHGYWGFSDGVSAIYSGHIFSPVPCVQLRPASDSNELPRGMECEGDDRELEANYVDTNPLANIPYANLCCMFIRDVDIYEENERNKA